MTETPRCRFKGCRRPAAYSLDVARIGAVRAFRVMVCETHGAKVHALAQSLAEGGDALTLERQAKPVERAR
jgi:hypothetical protein